MIRFLLFGLSLLAILSLAPASARDWFVNPETGNDEHDGSDTAPLATAQAAVELADSGDRIVLLPPGSLYRQTIDLRKAKNGVVIEGNKVTLTGADPLQDAEWETLGDNLFRTKLPRTRLDRHLLIVNGKAERMKRGTSNPIDFPPVEELLPGQFRWDLIDEESGYLTVSGPTDGLEWSVRANGIATSGQIRNIKVFNLSARHFLNDGFNIHGDSRGLQFFGIHGYENFDEGFSAHETSECWIYDSRFFGNENAIADVGEAETYYINCEMGGSERVEILFQGGRHSLTRCTVVAGENSTILSIDRRSSGEKEVHSGPASLVLQEVKFDVSANSGRRFAVGPDSHVFHDAATGRSISELNVSVHTTSRLQESLYRTFAIGRDGSGSPLMVWAGAGTGNRPSQAYRIIHFGKHVPEEVAPKLSPDNDWLGLLSPLDSSDFPPTGPAYGPGDSSSHALWRWIGVVAPDAVFVPDTPEGLALGKALQENPPAEVGMVDVFLNRETEEGSLESIVLPNAETGLPPAKTEMQDRVRRTPHEVLTQLSANYGDHFSGSYIEALALIAKEEGGIENRAAELALEYLGRAPGVPGNGGEIAGTLLYAGIDDPRAKERVLKVAGMAFDAQGAPLEAMPTHNEMSDAIFMGCPLLARAGVLSGESRYFDQCLEHFRFIAALCLRQDGIYRHSPLNEAAWGRGNGFPALGLALVLRDFPPDHEGYAELLSAFQEHLSALAKYQDSNGMWHQIIDHPDSYPEFTATCMIAYAIAAGLNENWLEPAEWTPVLESAWNAVKMHISTDGKTILNVCTGTGKQPGLEDYYRREAILGIDSRGGAMAMMLASEMKKRYKP